MVLKICQPNHPSQAAVPPAGEQTSLIGTERLSYFHSLKDFKEKQNHTDCECFSVNIF